MPQSASDHRAEAPDSNNDARQLEMSNRENGESGAVAPVSVVIPYYNSSSTIAAAVSSVRRQTLGAAEIIIVDDGSRPEEGRALADLATHCTIINLRQNRGVSVARNVGIGRSSARWIAFLDADDCWEPTKLEAQFDLLRANPDCRAVHCSNRRIRPNGDTEVFIKSQVSFEDLLTFPPPVFPSALLVERDLLLECGLFDPNLRVCEDLDLVMRITQCVPILCVADVLLIRREQPSSASRNLRNFWYGADLVYRRLAALCSEPKRAWRALTDLNADFVCGSLYARDWALLRSQIPHVLRRDVKAHRLAAAVLRFLIKNRQSAAASKNRLSVS
jgi:glycosyltransferase involved in cell wall biosynthesis